MMTATARAKAFAVPSALTFVVRFQLKVDIRRALIPQPSYMELRTGWQSNVTSRRRSEDRSVRLDLHVPSRQRVVGYRRIPRRDGAEGANDLLISFTGILDRNVHGICAAMHCLQLVDRRPAGHYRRKRVPLPVSSVCGDRQPIPNQLSQLSRACVLPFLN